MPDMLKTPRSGIRKWLLRLQIVFFILAFLVSIGVWWLERSVKPVILSMGEARVRALAIQAVNSAVRETVGELVYDDLVNVHIDGAGRVTMLQMNTSLMNQISSLTAIAAQRRMAEIGEQGISISLFTALGSQMLAGYGPIIHTRVLPVGSVTTSYESEFSAAGINQTRHRIFLCLTANVRVVLPNTSRSVEVVTQVPIAESIVVGDVPDTYFNIDEVNDPLDLAPN